MWSDNGAKYFNYFSHYWNYQRKLATVAYLLYKHKSYESHQRITSFAYNIVFRCWICLTFWFLIHNSIRRSFEMYPLTKSIFFGCFHCSGISRNLPKAYYCTNLRTLGKPNVNVENMRGFTKVQSLSQHYYRSTRKGTLSSRRPASTSPGNTQSSIERKHQKSPSKNKSFVPRKMLILPKVTRFSFEKGRFPDLSESELRRKVCDILTLYTLTYLASYRFSWSFKLCWIRQALHGSNCTFLICKVKTCRPVQVLQTRNPFLLKLRRPNFYR